MNSTVKNTRNFEKVASISDDNYEEAYLNELFGLYSNP